MGSKLQILRRFSSPWIEGTNPEHLDALVLRVKNYEDVIHNFPGGIILTDAALNVILCNEQQMQLLDYPESLFDNRVPTLIELFEFNASRGEYGPGNPDELVAAKMELVKKRIPHVFERKRPDGRVLEIRGTPLPAGGFVTSYTDVTERRRSQEIIERIAMSDVLTGLPNRFLMAKHFEVLASRTSRGEHFALHYIDLDDFKPINDRYGHAAGDAVLSEVAKRMNVTIRKIDFAARVGGDEFIVLQAAVDGQEDVNTLADRLIDAIIQPINVDGIDHTLSASIGAAVSNQFQHPILLEKLIEAADTEMYRCKKMGKGTYRIAG
jgi:diguanylate cyclase (GGDEF)-like protein